MAIFDFRKLCTKDYKENGIRLKGNNFTQIYYFTKYERMNFFSDADAEPGDGLCQAEGAKFTCSSRFILLGKLLSTL